MASAPITIEPVVSYPRQARPGERHFLTVDVQHQHPPDQWPYEQEELTLTCLIHTPLFKHEPLGEQSIVLHRFGGSYGPAAFLLTAKESLQTGAITLSFVNRHGMTVHTVVLDDIKIVEQASASQQGYVQVPSASEGSRTREGGGNLGPPSDKPTMGSEEWITFSEEVSGYARERILVTLSDFREYLVLNGIVEGPIAPVLIRGFSNSPGSGYFDRQERGIRLIDLGSHSSDTLRREYAHHVLMPERVEMDVPLAAVESGLADYLVCSFKNDPLFGQAEARQTGGLFLRNLANRLSFTRPPDSTIPGLGEIWGGVFWELRQHFGAQVIDQLVTQAWRETEVDFPRALLRRMARRSFEKFEKTSELLLARGALNEREQRSLLIESVQPLELSLPPLALDRREALELLSFVGEPAITPLIRVIGYYGQASATLLRMVGLLAERRKAPIEFFLFDVPSNVPSGATSREFVELFLSRIETVVSEARRRHPARQVVVGIANFHRFHASLFSNRPFPPFTPVMEPGSVNYLESRLMHTGATFLLACRPDTPASDEDRLVTLGDLSEKQVRSLCKLYGVTLSEEGVREFLLWTGGSLHLAEIALQGARQHEWFLEDLMRFEGRNWSRIFDAEMARVRQWLDQQSRDMTEALAEFMLGDRRSLPHDLALPLMGQGLILRASERNEYTLRSPLYSRVLEPDAVARLPREFRDRVGNRRWSLEARRLGSPSKRGLRLILVSHDPTRYPLPRTVRFRLTPDIEKTARATSNWAAADFFVSASFGPVTAYVEMESQGERCRLSIPIDDIALLPKADPPKPRGQTQGTKKKKPPRRPPPSRK